MSGTVPVETLEPGDLLLLDGLVGQVEVERLDRHPAVRGGGEVIYIRWRSAGLFPRSHHLAGEPVELGSLKPLRAGDLVKVP